MPDLYALLVGIDRYDSPDVPDLGGCVTDVRSAAELLRDTAPPGTRVDLRLLVDAGATRDAVVAAIREHLGRAGAGDTALLWFSGHGSEAPVPPWAWFHEPGGRLQTLVCADSRTAGVPDLWDKELSVLLDVVAERAGHVAVVLDSCHSEGATRDLLGHEPAAVARSVRPDRPRALDSLIAEVRERTAAGATDHVVLAACRSTESAQEMPIGGVTRGVFSWAVLEALRRRDGRVTYRELLAAAQTGVEQHSRQQTPQLRPAVSPLADHLFLDGRASRRGTGIRMRRAPEGWEIDAGAVHGLPGGGIRVGVRGGGPVREAVVTRVRTRTSLVEPEHGWDPDPDEQFPVAVTEVPLPRTTVAFTGDPAGAGRIAGALATAGPSGGPSPHLLAVGAGTTVPGLRADVTASGGVLVTDHHGERIADLTLGDGESVREVVAALEHIARWRLLLRLDNPVTSLVHPVRVEIVLPEPGEVLAPKTGGRSPEFSGGVHHLRYARSGDGGWAPPEFFLRLHNTSDRMLYCVLLDLTPRFEAHATLFPGDFIAPGERGAALSGRRVQAHLPSGVLPAPGLSVLDRLRLFVAEEQFSQQPFLLPPLGSRGTGRAAFGRRGLMERLAGTAVHRDLAGIEDTGAYDWTTETILVRTEVPPLS